MSEQVQLLTEDWGLPIEPSDTESIRNINITESTDGRPGTFISGIFMQAEKVNGNGRIYPRPVLEKAVNEYINTQVNRHQALGELNHPNRSTPDPREAAIIIEKLWFEGNNVMGCARVLDTPNGQIVKSLINGGWIPGVSSRGLGRVKAVNGINEVQDGFKLTVGVDVVHGPSAPDAYVKGYTTTESSVKEENIKEEVTKTVSPVKDDNFSTLKNVEIVSLTETLKSML